MSKFRQTPYPYDTTRWKKAIHKTHSIRARTGVTLISTLISVTIILVALIGTTTFRYHATLDVRKAAAQTNASRIALMLCENWRGIQGDTSYDPADYLAEDMTMTFAQNEGPVNPEDFNLLGSFKIILDAEENGAEGNDYYATLSWKDVQAGLRALNVIVTWAQRGQSGFENTDKSYRLTTYVMTL